ncbi:MAG: PAS domain S-box protein, partial [Candidatus Helarchaeales archaeon]
MVSTGRVPLLLIGKDPQRINRIRELLNKQNFLKIDLQVIDELPLKIRRLEIEPVKIVLIDHEFLQAAGWETLDGLKNLLGWIPIIMFSDIDDESIMLKIFEHDIQDYLNLNGLDEKILLKAVLRALGYARQRVELISARKKMEDLNSLLLSIEAFNQKVPNIDTKEELINAICESLIGTTGYSCVFCILLNPTNNSIEAISQKSTTFSCLNTESIETIEDLPECCRQVIVLQSNKFIQSTRQECRKCLDAKDIEDHHALFFPIKDKEKLFGLFGIHISKDREIYQQEIDILQDLGKFIFQIMKNIQAERTLKDSEEKFRTLTEHSIAGLVIFLNSRIIFINSMFTKITGYEKEDLENATIEDVMNLLFMKEDVILAKQRLQNLTVKLDEVSSNIYKIKTKRGETKWIQTFTKFIPYKGNRGLMCSIVDISEQTEMELKLQESEYQLALRNEISNIFLTQPKDRVFLEVTQLI